MRILSELLIIVIVVVLLIGGAYYYYTDSQNKLRKLTKERAELIIINDSYQETLKYIQEQNEMNERRSIALRTQLVEAEKYSDQLIAKLRRHDLTVLTMQKPGLIENRVNNATKELFNDFERITSSTN